MDSKHQVISCKSSTGKNIILGSCALLPLLQIFVFMATYSFIFNSTLEYLVIVTDVDVK